MSGAFRPRHDRRRIVACLAAAVAGLGAEAGCAANASSPAAVTTSDTEAGWWQAVTIDDGGEPAVWSPSEPIPADRVVSLPADALFFETGSAVIAPEGSALLDQVAAALIDSGTVMLVVGHTDSVGTDAANETLGLARATAVAAALVERGVPDAQLGAVVSQGERSPVAPNTDPAGRARNRRVDLVPHSTTVAAAIDREQEERR